MSSWNMQNYQIPINIRLFLTHKISKNYNIQSIYWLYWNENLIYMLAHVPILIHLHVNESERDNKSIQECLFLYSYKPRLTTQCESHTGRTCGLSLRLKNSPRFLQCCRSSTAASFMLTPNVHIYNLKIGFRNHVGRSTWFKRPQALERSLVGMDLQIVTYIPRDREFRDAMLIYATHKSKHLQVSKLTDLPPAKQTQAALSLCFFIQTRLYYQKSNINIPQLILNGMQHKN